MNNPVLYSKANILQRTGSLLAINYCKKLMKWQKQETVLDVGAGDGGTTAEILLPILPKNFNKIVGVDISKDMVEFAKIRCQNPKIDFRIFDIASHQVPLELQEHFHHIFSFYCFHWVADQKQAMKNTFRMLKPGGQVLIAMASSGPPFDGMLQTAKSKKWAPYMTNVHNVVPLYHYLDQPEKKLEHFLTQEGFICHISRSEEVSSIYPNFTVFANFVCAVNPFIKNIPPNEVHEYIEEYVNINKTHKYTTVETLNGNTHVIAKHKLLFCFASKPVKL